MNSAKIENLLNLALDVREQERMRSPELSVGFEPADDTWEVIVRYFGELQSLQSQFPDWQITELLNEYAIIQLPESQIAQLAGLPQIEYIEKPKQLYFEAAQGRRASCMLPVQTGRGAVGSRTNLTGAGVLVAVIDSGIDYRHPDFCSADGTTRIVALWDQTAVPRSEQERAPQGYSQGVEYTSEQINEALSAPDTLAAAQIVPETDTSGHGTHVAGIAAGNGRASGGANRGVAYESELLIVKLGVPGGGSFPRTTELMTAVDYCIRKARELLMPLAINLSFGNNYGSHSGTSLLETYLTDIAGYWKCNIVAGSGNEAAKRVHTSGVLGSREARIELAVAEYETGLNIQLWKSYSDQFTITLIHPNGNRREVIAPVPGSNQFRMENTTVLIYYGEPSPYSQFQEIYFELLPEENAYIDSGIWQIVLTPERIVDGEYNFWLPAGSTVSPATGFLDSVPETTLTIPSTAFGVITVGAYDSFTDAPAVFSGRGYTRALRQVKPDLVAPGVDIISCAPGGGYASRTGTSMATPFVTGAVALLMQWGIVAGRDPYLYGEKVKAYLISGARALPSMSEYPNPQLGWGALCVSDSLPE
ncbi:MAG: S8 family serine peptidase [Lachnospiraceae bacterium]|nr:S8 family serine peptidase [Lachnospiraceae bacterium]